MQMFRRRLLLRLHQAERLSESFMHNLLSWVHPGFSVYAGPPVQAAAIASLESQARYITRPVLAVDALEKLDDGSLVLETPPDPKSGATSIALDPLEWIHRITSHIIIGRLLLDGRRQCLVFRERRPLQRLCRALR